MSRVARKLRVCALYPSRMNIYADRGNMLLLEQRCRARGIDFELTACEVGDALDASRHDLFYIGGGQDSDQLQIAEDLRTQKRASLSAAAEDGKVLLAVCGGYQLLGDHYEVGGRKVGGLALVDLHTVREPGPRLTGNVLIETSLAGGDRLLAGFENHGGRTYLGAGVPPMGRVLSGHGNNGKDRTEGVHFNNVFGTYLHGPLLPKNAWFADELVRLALQLDRPLDPLDDELERRAHDCAVRAARHSGSWRDLVKARA